jgi:predicted HTH domain antitoxin
MMMTIDIPKEIFESSRMTADELKVELAVTLYSAKRLSIGKSRELAGMSLWQFRQLLASRGIAAHLDEEDLNDDVASLNELDIM